METLSLRHVFKNFVRLHPRQFALYILLLVFLAGERVAIPHVYGRLVDLLRRERFGEIQGCFLILVAIYLLFQLFDGILTYLDADLMPQLESYSRQLMSDFVVNNMQGQHEELRLGDLTSKMVKMPVHVRALFQRIKVFVFNHMLSVAMSASYLLWCHPLLGAVFTTNALIIGVTTYFFCIRCVHKSYQRELALDVAHENLQDTFYNLVSVYCCNREHAERQRSSRNNDRVNRSARSHMLCGLPYRLVLALLFVLVFAGCTYTGIYLFRRGAITLSLFVSSFIVTFTMLRTCMSFYFDFESFIYVYGAIRVVQDFLLRMVAASPESPVRRRVATSATAAPPSAPVRRNRGGEPAAPPRIRVVGMWYSVGDKHVLRNVSFEVPPHTLVKIGGAVGTGKSTLAKLLARLLLPTRGAIYLDDQNMADMAPADVRHLVYYSPQHPRLFHRRLYDNIVYGIPPGRAVPPPEEVSADLLRLQLHADVRRHLTQNMLRSVGKHGSALSGGQKQIVLLLRAWYRRAPVYVLDEPTAALDAQSVQAVVQIIRAISRDASVVVISHDAAFLGELSPERTIVVQ